MKTLQMLRLTYEKKETIPTECLCHHCCHLYWPVVTDTQILIIRLLYIILKYSVINLTCLDTGLVYKCFWIQSKNKFTVATCWQCI